MTGSRKLLAWMVADACLVLLASTGCNAVFGLDDVSFGTGGAAASTTDAATTDASSASDGSTSSATGTGSGGGGGGGGEVCETVELATYGEFGADWDVYWDVSGATATIEQIEGDDALRVTNTELYGSITDDLLPTDLCPGACVTARFALRVQAGLQLGVGVSNGDGDQTMGLMATRAFEPTEAFETVTTEPCRVRADFTAAEILGFATTGETSDIYLDDVELFVGDCPSGETADCPPF